MDWLQVGKQILKLPEMTPPIVAFHSAAKTFGTVPAVRDITLAITPDNGRKVIGFLNEFRGTDFGKGLVQSGFDYNVAAKAS